MATDETSEEDFSAFHGTIIHSLSLSELEVLENALLVVSPQGRIVCLASNVPRSDINSILLSHDIQPSLTALQILTSYEFLIPGFADTHNHAPQWTQRGLGLGLPLLTWLTEVTFPHEARFSHTTYASRTYASLVTGMINQGVTTASYYGSLHLPATKILAETCLRLGQRALIGKCNMNRNAVSFYTETSTQSSLAETEDSITHIRSIDPKGDLINPILTPRFAISCTNDLLSALGTLSQSDPTLRIQTHFNEAPDEISFTRTLFPEFTNEVDLYAHYNLLTPRTILAHAIFNTNYEMHRLASLDCGISHCPISNTTIPTFMSAPIRRFLNLGVKVGLGTDSGGGFSTSILDAMRHAMIVSNTRSAYHSSSRNYTYPETSPPSQSLNPNTSTSNDGNETPLSLSETFYLATLGGARVCSLDHVTGNFLVGKEFDGLVVRMPQAVEEEGMVRNESLAGTEIEEVDSPRTVWEKFLMTGDDRNIVGVWCRGRRIK